MRPASRLLLVALCFILASFGSSIALSQAASPEPHASPAKAAPPAAIDPAALVHRALIENKRSLDALRNYIFISDITEEEFGKDKNVSKTTTRREEHFFIDGEPVSRTLLVNGQPPVEKERLKNEKDLDEKLADAHSASPHNRNERQKKAAKALAEAMEMREDVVDAYVFTVAGEEAREDRRLIRIAAEPRPGFKGKSKLKALLPFLHGTLLIDAESGQWVEIDATLIRRLGGGPFYLGEESAIHLHQEPVAGGLWVMTRADIRLNVRILWEHKNMRVQALLHDFRRFGSTVSIVEPAEPAPAEVPATQPTPKP